MIGKEWDPENRNMAIWEDSIEAGATESLNSGVFLISKGNFSDPIRGVNPAWPEQTAMFPDGVALQDTANSPWDPPQPPLN